jgi:Domain of unknown function (DUF4267)
MLHHIVFFMGIGRIVLGVVPFVAASRASRMLGVPENHDNATGRLMARLFGVRDVGLGVLVFWALLHPGALAFVLVFNALTDFGDLAAICIPLIRREGIDRAAWISAAFALPAGVGWLAVYAAMA